MNIYLDLKKAVSQVPSTSTSSIDDRQASRKYNESFNKQSVGVHTSDTTDDPEIGAKWSHDSSLDEELEADRKRDTQVAKERGVVKSEIQDVLKSLTESATSLLPSMPNEAEIQFLTTECFKSEATVDKFGRTEWIRVPYTREDVLNGQASIQGADRARFNQWLHHRFKKSLGMLR